MASADSIVGAVPSVPTPTATPPVSAAMALAVGDITSEMAPAATYRCGPLRARTAWRLASESPNFSVSPSDWPACISAADSETSPAEPSAAPEPDRISNPAPFAPDTSTVSSNVTVRTPVPPSREADSTSGFTVSGVSAISVAEEAGASLFEVSFVTPASRRTCGSAYPMTDCLRASVSFILICASASTTEVTAEPVSAVPPAPSPSRTRIVARSTDAPSPTCSSKLRSSTPVPSLTDAETSTGPVVSAAGLGASFLTLASAASVPDALKALAAICTSESEDISLMSSFCAGLSPMVATVPLIESEDVESSVVPPDLPSSSTVIFPSVSALLVCAAMFWSNVRVSLPACRLPPCSKLFRSMAAELSTGSRTSRAEASVFVLRAASATVSASRWMCGFA